MLRELDLRPVLVDVGASGAPPAIWRAIAPESAYVGFDPDARELRRDAVRGFRSSLIVPKAVVADDAEATPLYLTASPFCSSTLPPDASALADYLFAPLFDVVGTTTTPATSLARVPELASIDWLKLDTQGTDLRIYESVPERVRTPMLALDVEPGLIDAYAGEDFFATAHARLVRDGWWLSDARVLGTVRVRRTSVERLRAHGVDETAIAASTRTSPGWVEARYLRTIEHLQRSGADARSYQLLSVFAMLDGQFGFAFDVAEAIDSEPLRAAAVAALKRNAARAGARRLARRLPASVRLPLGRVIDRFRGR